MSCERWREALSALVDGEDPGVDERLVDAHLARCPACRSYGEALEQTRGPLRIRTAQPMPDLSGRIVKLNALADRARRWWVIRALVAVVAIEMLVVSVPQLIFGQHVATSAHAARHLGAFTAAYGAALLVVAVRPARARTVLPVAATLALALLITAAVDVVEGRVPLLGEALHVPEILSVVLIWLLALPAGHFSRPGRAGTARPAALRMVDGPPSGSQPGTGAEAGSGAGVG